MLGGFGYLKFLGGFQFLRRRKLGSFSMQERSVRDVIYIGRVQSKGRRRDDAPLRTPSADSLAE